MANAYEECHGRILRVDLSRGEVVAERVGREVVRQCLGGASLGAKLLYDEVPPGVAWADPENRFIIASGPLGGTLVPGSGTFSPRCREGRGRSAWSALVLLGRTGFASPGSLEIKATPPPTTG